jgi:hypothetical protein
VRTGICPLSREKRVDGGEVDVWEIAGVTRTSCYAALRNLTDGNPSLAGEVERGVGLLLAAADTEGGMGKSRARKEQPRPQRRDGLLGNGVGDASVG